MTTKSGRTLYKLDQKFVDQLPFISGGHPKIYFDSTVKGFGVCVGKTVKTFVIQREINRKSVRTTIARTMEITVARAREEARNLLHEMRGGHNPNLIKKQAAEAAKEASYTLQMLLDQHLESLKLKGCIASANRYPKALNLHVKDWLELPVAAITREKVIERHRQIGLSTGKAAANAVFRTLRALYNLYRIDHAEFQNPVEILSLKKRWFPEKPRNIRIKPHEMKVWIQALLTQVENPVHKDYMLFLLLNGLRKNEGMNLAWDQVDFKGKSFRIEKTKNKKPLELPMTDLTEAILKSLWNRREIDNPLTSPWVFPSKLSITGHLYSVRNSLLAVNEASNMDINLHDLRRTFATIANMAKIPECTIKKLVNHSTAGSVTASVYIVMDVDALREPMQEITNAFKELMQIESAEASNVVPITQAAAKLEPLQHHA